MMVHMDITRFVESLRRDLVGAAEAAGPEGHAAAERILLALEPAVRLTVLELLAQAAAEISADLPAGVVEVRLRGRDPELVVDVPAQQPMPAPPAPPTPPGPPAPGEAEADAADGEGVARITLRLPESVKARAEELATRTGHSLNAWIVNALRSATGQGAVNVDIDLSSIPFGGHGSQRRMSGWV